MGVEQREPREVGGMGMPLTLHWVPDVSFISVGRGALVEGCPEIGTQSQEMLGLLQDTRSLLLATRGS